MTTTTTATFLKGIQLQTTASGIQYHIITEGHGPKPQSANSTVLVNYEGKLTDGTIFDSSYQRKQPISFKLNQVIPGWTEIVQMMPTGSTWGALIPANLAYGAQGIPNVIPPNSPLYFKIELIEVVSN